MWFFLTETCLLLNKRAHHIAVPFKARCESPSADLLFMQTGIAIINVWLLFSQIHHHSDILRVQFHSSWSLSREMKRNLSIFKSKVIDEPASIRGESSRGSNKKNDINMFSGGWQTCGGYGFISVKTGLLSSIMLLWNKGSQEDEWQLVGKKGDH